MISGVPLILALGARIPHPYVYVVFWAPILTEHHAVGVMVMPSSKSPL